MRFPQLIVYESDGRLAAPASHAGDGPKTRWSLREGRGRPTSAARGWPSPRGRPSSSCASAAIWNREMALVEEVGYAYPGAAAVVVGDAEHGRLVGMAWDLGAAYVHVPPSPREDLVAVVAGLMNVAFLEEAE